MDTKSANKKKRGKVKWIILALVVIAVLVFLLTDFLVDLLWFSETGYLSVFFKELSTKLKLGVPVFLAAGAVDWLFLALLKRNFLKKSELALSDAGDKKLVRWIAVILAAIFGILVSAVVVSRLWFQILEFANATDFGIVDPLFGRDLGFYMFRLEFLEGLNASAIFFIVALMLTTLVFYVLLVSLADPKDPEEATTYDYEVPSEDGQEPHAANRFGGMMGDFMDLFNNPRRSPGTQKTAAQWGRALLAVASREACILGVLLFAAIGVNYYLKQFDLLYGGTGVAYGAGFTDINITLNIYRIMMVLALVCAVTTVLAILRRKLKLGIIAPIVMIVVAIVGGPIASFVQNVIVAPDELSKESRYIGYNIEYTRSAYDLKDIAVKDFNPQSGLTKEDVLDNMETFSNIRINDFEPAEQFYNQTQSIRSYYTFNDVDVDRYYVNGEYTQAFLSAREIDGTRIDNSWLIRHLKYTHGYGLTLSRVDRVTSSGQPDMLIDSIPPVSEVPEIAISRPEIYYGELTNDYVLVNTDEEEFDYPAGESNRYCEYEGTGGIRLGFFNRILFAIHEQSLKLLVSTNVNSDSRILIHRSVLDRVSKIAPFLAYEDNPYLVVDEGRLYWMIDAFTMSEYYPYSEPYDIRSDANYIRNSVKVVIDAYNGDVSFYISEPDDPIIQTLAKIYRGVFRSIEEMPAGLRAHTKYPNSLFEIQAKVYRKYHMTDVDVFYQSEDLWAIANETYGQKEIPLSAINFIMRLPGEDRAEFIASVPYTPSGKSNMTGLLMARSDGAHYGELVLYRLPKDRIIYGPAQIEAQINQDTEISKEFSLWNNSGSSYSRGNMFVFPVGDSLLYAEPIYLEASTGSLPEVKRVIVYYGDRLAYESTLAECLDVLFGEGAGDPLLTAHPIESGHEMAQALRDAASLPPQPGPQDDPSQSGGQQGGQPGGQTPVDPESAEFAELVQLANDVYESAIAAQREGDWAAYGEHMKTLQSILQKLAGTGEAQQGGEETPQEQGEDLQTADEE